MIEIIVFLTLLLIGFIFGRINETKHFSELNRREAELDHIKISNFKTIPEQYRSSEFVTGSVVISIDYFKRIGAGLRTLVGGQIGSYTSLIERARREAILRMKEQAQLDGSEFVANVRLETASVYKNARTGLGSLEVFAYGTALK
jgi:uncharacterized protein YbjQ (UPF0145 family)